MQNTFFTQAADVLTRREALRAFVALCECLAGRAGACPIYAITAIEMITQSAI